MSYQAFDSLFFAVPDLTASMSEADEPNSRKQPASGPGRAGDAHWDAIDVDVSVGELLTTGPRPRALAVGREWGRVLLGGD
jgi:hypothetical protein